MENQGDYSRRTILGAAGSALGLSAVQIQNAEIAAADAESIQVNRAPFTEVAVGHDGVGDFPVLISCDASPFVVGEKYVSLVDHTPERYRSKQSIVSVNGSIREASGTVFSGETRSIPVKGDSRGRSEKSLRLPKGETYQLPEVEVHSNPGSSTAHVDGETYEVAEGESRRIELSEREITISDDAGERERTFVLTPTVEIQHHGVMDVLGKEGHAVLPLGLVKNRASESELAELSQVPNHDVVVIPEEVSN